jgi:hypothetical protein
MRGNRGAALSHRAAAAAWDLLPPPAGRLDVTSLRRSVPTRGIRGHRSTSIHPLDDVVRQPDGLPVTTVARTLVDLAAVVTPHQLQRITHRAEFLRLLDAGDVHRLLDGSRRRGHRASAAPSRF